MSEIMGFTYSRYKFQKKVEKCRTLIYTCAIMKISIRSGKYDLPHLVKQVLL